MHEMLHLPLKGAAVARLENSLPLMPNSHSPYWFDRAYSTSTLSCTSFWQVCVTSYNVAAAPVEALAASPGASLPYCA